MKKIAVIYWSGTGNTEMMAKKVYEAAKENGADIELVRVSGTSADEAAEYDVLLLGCPAMGAEVLEEEEFEPFFSELECRLRGKNVGLFGSYGWGDGEWMRCWKNRAESAGAIVFECVMANYDPDKNAEEKCAELGRKAAEI